MRGQTTEHGSAMEKEESTQLGEGQTMQDLDYPTGAEHLCRVIGTGSQGMVVGGEGRRPAGSPLFPRCACQLAVSSLRVVTLLTTGCD